MPNTAPENHLHVVAAVITNPLESRQVLISRRHIRSHQGGKWEFPGGKVEQGEIAAQALKRELHEELGIDVISAMPFIRVNHAYPDKMVHLDVWRVDDFRGTPAGREGQALEWVWIQNLRDYDYPQANMAVISALELPPVYAISAAGRMGRVEFEARLKKALDDGLKLLQLREPGMNPDEFSELAESVIALCHHYGARVVLNADVDTVNAINADGIQLNSRVLAGLNARPLARGKLVIASCHNSEELTWAQSIEADAALLSPVLETPSHPGATTLGWEKFRRLVSETGIPVYALGGMTPELLKTALANGAVGIAMISAFWQQYA